MAATMKDPVNFSIGEPDFGAPAEMKRAAIEAIESDKSGYTVTSGLAQLREELAGRISREFGWSNPSVLITCGLSGALTLSLMATVNAGDGVLIPDPYFVSYRHLVNLNGGKCQFVNTYPDFGLTCERLDKAADAKSKVLFVNSPANPTGVLYQTERLKEIAGFAQRRDLLVLSDEIYREFTYDGQADSIGHYYENTMVMRSFSKCYGVPGWRLGYVAVPEHLSGLADAMATLQQYTFVCAPHPFQLATMAALQCDISGHIADYHRKRDMIYDGLKDKFDLVKLEGAFYAFVAAPGGDATAFVEKAIKNDVLVIPGSVFSEQDSHFRLSYATSDEMIAKGIERLISLV